MPLTDIGELSKKRCSHPIIVKLKYPTKKNFLGRPVDGYVEEVTNLGLLSTDAAEALCEVQNYLNEKFKLGLKIYDAYRPKRAVKHFMMWAKEPADEIDATRKPVHYPQVDKEKFFDLGYVAEDSGHCYGNTVDLVLTDLTTGKKIPMGSRFDFMGKESHADATAEMIGEEAVSNRKILADAMAKFGFQPYFEEYWHFSHKGKEGREYKEPLDLIIDEELRGAGVTLKASM